MTREEKLLKCQHFPIWSVMIRERVNPGVENDGPRYRIILVQQMINKLLCDWNGAVHPAGFQSALVFFNLERFPEEVTICQGPKTLDATHEHCHELVLLLGSLLTNGYGKW